MKEEKEEKRETKSNDICHSLISIMQEIDYIGKTKTNQQQGYKFRGIDDMYNSLQPLFKKHGVFITSNVMESKREERQTQRGGALIYSILKCEFKFIAQDGSFVTSILEGEAMDSGDKSTNKAMSTALKYALMQMFLIPTEEKIDTEYETHNVMPKIDESLNMHQWITLVNGCKTMQELQHAYRQNKDAVESTPEIKQLFANRKTQL